MNKDEIIRYIKLGRNKSICVDRRLLDQYAGHVRDVTIMDDATLMIEFNVYEYDEGGLTINVYYNDYDTLINAVQEYIGLNIEMWENISKSGWYPILEEEVDFNQSDSKLKHDLVNKTLLLPPNGNIYQIPSGYWKDLADGLIQI
ncbi:hypothetical protein [Acetonema longum]|uniref:Uncharacterized protein n=1 Tax=Acetonema longum DSM 6540 TaxID=1009370 RepID=F7NQ98_9FIRM|nr:hypothetical protein [Acetonema longum]EGO61783.1 hypothetical protein ALO_21496 [Acetonema longum DSM 6540]